ncbi:PHP domain-containing protein [Neptunomonas sp.]|uniref:PHP domain-containing protein n=1 Tax=Neptunomonas sp. TaxID=1971898 RepID=UPI003564442D
MLAHSYDFHTHSTASDGTLAPEVLIEKACAAGVKLLALTDHDTMKGYQALVKSGYSADLKLITGVELTCKLEKQVVHIVGLNIDADNERLTSHLQMLDQLRMDRAKAIALRLQKAGLPDLLEAAIDCAAGGQIGRPHFARALLDLKLVSDQQQAFKKYLGAGKKGDVKVEWPELASIIDIIKDAGGLSILAHPTKYNLTMNKIRYLVAHYSELGGDALEVGYPAVTPDHQKALSVLVEKHQLLASGGSDFHNPAYHWTSLGCFPGVPGHLPHVLDVVN